MAVKRLLRYLRAAQTYGLLISRPKTNHINAYADADWETNPDDCKSITGFTVACSKFSIEIFWSSYGVSSSFHLCFILSCFKRKQSNASLPAEVYWKSMLPNTSMPKALQDLLQPGNEITISFAEDDSINSRGGYGQNGVEYNVAYWNELRKTSFIPSTPTIFFLYDDLLPHKNMTLNFTKSNKTSNFLPRKIAETIPFSSNMLPQILKYFSIEPSSKEAQTAKRTIEDCEAPNIRGENKYCATSLESLVDFVITKFGKKVQALANEAEKKNKEQEYTILKGIKMIGDNQIVCHKQRYAYAVFYCHTINAMKAYTIPLEGVDGSKAKAIAVCHTDTSAWNPKHIAFQILKVKPGGPPICHFVNSDTIVWVPN
ncbi:BURP domain-containing protein 5-like [Hevea brasiliensis]|nr:BURP domain-containing protein 5-like [Hevea brasiliensis]